jgi:antitoxin YefM
MGIQKQLLGGFLCSNQSKQQPTPPQIKANKVTPIFSEGPLTICTHYGTLYVEVKGMVKNISVRSLRSNLAGVLDKVSKYSDRYIILKRGEPRTVIMSIDDYEGWLETLEIMSSKEAMASIKAAKKELKAGKGLSFEDVFGKPKRYKKAS